MTFSYVCWTYFDYIHPLPCPSITFWSPPDSLIPFLFPTSSLLLLCLFLLWPNNFKSISLERSTDNLPVPTPLKNAPPPPPFLQQPWAACRPYAGNHKYWQESILAMPKRQQPVGSLSFLWLIYHRYFFFCLFCVVPWALEGMIKTSQLRMRNHLFLVTSFCRNCHPFQKRSYSDQSFQHHKSMDMIINI